MDIAEALHLGRRKLARLPTGDADARRLLAHVLGVAESVVLAFPERAVSAESLSTYHALLARAARGEPLAYLTGRRNFRRLSLHVTPAVLIPRPETEQLVELALHWARAHRATRIADIGTGSGCIALALATELGPSVTVDAVDVALDALAVARANADRLGVTRVRFHHGSLLEPISRTLDLIVANPPYVTEGEWTELDDGVKYYEPKIALTAGADGLVVIRQLLQQAPGHLRPGGALFLEIGWQQGAAVVALARAAFPGARVTLHRDYAGHERMVSIETDGERTD